MKEPATDVHSEENLILGNGAQFWTYISPQNETASRVTEWHVQIEQANGEWRGDIDSTNPRQKATTPGLSGKFNLVVTASGPNFPKTTLSPLPDSQPDIGCNSNCAAMIGIVANEAGTGAHYWTVWDALCSSR